MSGPGPRIFVLARSVGRAQVWLDQQEPPLYAGQYRFLASPASATGLRFVDGDRVVYVGRDWADGPWEFDVHRCLISSRALWPADLDVSFECVP